MSLTSRNQLQISFLILSIFKWIDDLLSSLKSSKNPTFSDDFKNREISPLIDLNSLNIQNTKLRMEVADSSYDNQEDSKPALRKSFFDSVGSNFSRNILTLQTENNK